MRIVYNSFHGRFSDNPKAIYERLAGRTGLEHVWLVHPAHEQWFPADVRGVDIDGREAREVLESADVLVANTHTEVTWDKSPGTTYLQTWHGTPLKRIHNDVLWAPPGRLARLDLDIAKWDLLLSPNAVSTPRLAKAFGFNGPIAETGYPRNDALLGPAADDARASMRAALGLDPATTVVLYAPTWRDDETFAEGGHDVRMVLDVPELMRRLPGDHTLLVRAHNMLTGRSTFDATPRVEDVSFYPDIRDLYLAADVLVTDYSSTMFDFANTGRPMIFFAYDLDRFRDSVRGFYFDFLPEAPGPIVQTTEELAEALLEVDALHVQYASRYESFRATYCSLEDGAASERAVALLGLPT